LDAIAHAGDTAVNWLIVHWWITVIVALFLMIEAAVAVAYLIARPVIHVLDRAAPVHHTSYPHDARPARPVPIELDAVSVWYPGAAQPALDDLTASVAEGCLVAVTGPNGSGKSTLGRVISGMAPTTGS